MIIMICFIGRIGFRLPNVCLFDSLIQNKHHSEYLFKMQSKHFFSNEFIDLWRFQRIWIRRKTGFILNTNKWITAPRRGRSTGGP